MKLVDFTHSHIEQARELAKQNYEEERTSVTALPPIANIPNLAEFADNNLGVTAVKGIWSPLHAHAVVGNKETIYKQLYQAAAEKWVAAGAVSHAITLYAHESEAICGFFKYGFGLRCIDAICSLNDEMPAKTQKYCFSELPKENAADTTALRNILNHHLGKSPCFLTYPQTNRQDAINIVNHRNSRVFTVNDPDKIIGYIEIMERGENFVCGSNDMMNICGACLLPEYRGTGLFTDLLYYLMNTLKAESYTLLGVDFESFNPTAYGFWLKYFTAYTNSVVRRIDGVTTC